MKYDPYAVYELASGLMIVRSAQCPPHENTLRGAVLHDAQQVSRPTSLATAIQMRNDLNHAKGELRAAYKKSLTTESKA